MLVIMRRPREAVRIGEATVTILEVTHDRHGVAHVKLGIDAPCHIMVERDDMKKGRKDDDL